MGEGTTVSLFLDDGDVKLYHGDCLDQLRALPDGCVDMVATSPPFYGLRDYGVDGQIGLEETPSCGAHGLMRLRADLTPDQRAYVAQRLLGVESRDE